MSLDLLVSIPKRVSAKVELNVLRTWSLSLQFQSLKGFQPKWNVEPSGFAVTPWINRVSIPKRVSAKVERS